MKINMKQALIAIALAGVFSSAQATTFVPLTGGTDLGADPTNAFEYIVAHAPGAFSDVFTFSLSSLSDTISSAVGLGGSGFSISDGTLSLFSDPGGDGAGTAGGANVQLATSTWGSSSGSVAFNNAAAGNYYWAVTGTEGELGGAYLYAANTAAVPEPETYALMLAGLGLIGFIGRRRLTQGNSGLNFA